MTRLFGARQLVSRHCAQTRAPMAAMQFTSQSFKRTSASIYLDKALDVYRRLAANKHGRGARMLPPLLPPSLAHLTTTPSCFSPPSLRAPVQRQRRAPSAGVFSSEADFESEVHVASAPTGGRAATAGPRLTRAAGRPPNPPPLPPPAGPRHARPPPPPAQSARATATRRAAGPTRGRRRQAPGGEGGGPRP